MADFEAGFLVVMQHEDDPKIRGKITRNNDGRHAEKLSDVPIQFQPTAVQTPGGDWYYGYTRTRYGVDERAHPELRNGGFYSTMNTEAAFAVAKTVFRKYWTFDSVLNEIVAIKVFDASINMGPGNALKVLQAALGSINKTVFTWQWGPSMLNAVNSADPELLIKALTQCATDYYNSDAKRQHLAKTPAGWLVRAVWEGLVPVVPAVSA